MNISTEGFCLINNAPLIYIFSLFFLFPTLSHSFEIWVEDEWSYASYQVSVVDLSTYHELRGFYEFYQGSGELTLLFFDFQLPKYP